MFNRKTTICSMILFLLGIHYISCFNGADSTNKDFKPVSWSVEYSPEVSSTISPNLRNSIDQETVRYAETEAANNLRLSSSQETFFDAQRELNPRSLQGSSNQWTGTTINSGGNGGSSSSGQLSDNQPTKPSLSHQIPATNTNWSAQFVTYEGSPNGESFPYSTVQPLSSTSQYESTHLDGRGTSTRPSLDFHKPLIATGFPQSVTTGGHSYITRETIARHLAGAPLWQDLIQRAGAIKGDHHLLPLDQQLQLQALQATRQTQLPAGGRQAASGKTSTWLKTFGAKRRSFEPSAISSDNQLAHRLAGVSFDDTIEAIRVKEPDQLRAAKDYLTSYSTMPYVYDLPPPPSSPQSQPSLERKNMKISYADDDHFGSVDHLLSGSKSIGHSIPATAFYPAYPTYSATHAHVAPRKGLEKALGVPILVGIGAALISFLIISNLFLSVPLFAMTLLQLINGSANLMPNNNMSPNNNNGLNNGGGGGQNGGGGGQTTNGRKRRDLGRLENDIERRFQKAIDGFS